MRTPVPPLRRRRRGAAAIEFALCLPIFLAILFGILEYGWVFYEQANVIAAVRSGVRYGVTKDPDTEPAYLTEAETTVRNSLAGLGIGSADLLSATIVASVAPSTSSTNLLTVSCQVPYTPVVGLVPAPSRISYSMTMLMEN
jgi:Flp pilus assembly protein TadG